jgi:hypothetical protein
VRSTFRMRMRPVRQSLMVSGPSGVRLRRSEQSHHHCRYTARESTVVKAQMKLPTWGPYLPALVQRLTRLQ